MKENYNKITETKVTGKTTGKFYWYKKLAKKHHTTTTSYYHRLDGPCMIYYDYYGNVTSQTFGIYDGKKTVNYPTEQQYWLHPVVVEYKLNKILEL